MFTLRVQNPFGCRGVSCVKLPAAVAFPTDDRLLQRIEASRRALPRDNMKSLRKRREAFSVISASVHRVQDVEALVPSKTGVLRAATDRLAVRSEPRPFPHLVRIEELYLRSRVAAGQR